MTPEARKIWATPAGQALMGRMFSGETKTQEDLQVIAQLKEVWKIQAMANGAKPPKIDSPRPGGNQID